MEQNEGVSKNLGVVLLSGVVISCGSNVSIQSDMYAGASRA